MDGRNVPPIVPAGGTVWGTTVGGVNTGVAVLANGLSAILDTKNSPFLSAFGNCSAAATISILYSVDGINFYVAHSVTLTGAGNFCIDCLCGGQFVQLQASAPATIWATISAKG